MIKKKISSVESRVRVFSGELYAHHIHATITEVNLSEFVYRLFHGDFSLSVSCDK